MTSADCRIFLRESDFPNIGSSDTFTVWFSGNTEEETMLLLEKFNEMKDVSAQAHYDAQTNMKMFLMYIRFSVILFSPIFLLGLILFFVRDIQSREDEFELLYSLGIKKKKLFIYLAVDYLC